MHRSFMPLQGVLPRSPPSHACGRKYGRVYTDPLQCQQQFSSLAVTGTGHGENSLTRHGQGDTLGILRLRARDSLGDEFSWRSAQDDTGVR